MIRIRFRIATSWRYRALPIVGLFFSMLLIGLLLAPERPTRAREATITAFPEVGGRHFYLTDTSYRTDQALTACASGYHMASLWEILDVSNLTYDYNHPDAHTKDDSGFGPPSYWYGWIRTGQNSSGSPTTGTGNCLNWSNISASNNGVSVRLSRTWETAPGDISTWDATSFTCNFTGPVWCVGDFSVVYVPITIKGP